MTYSVTTASDLESQLRAQVHTGNKPYVVALAGGSASGKTTFAATLASQLGDSCVLFSQDLFQLGKDFINRDRSIYKWDDPENFALQECAKSLQGLAANESVQVPNFDVIANKRLGTRMLTPAPVILWEGIYAIATHELRSTVDRAVYIDAPFAIRLLRRISRFLERPHLEIKEYAVPARQALTFVLNAHVQFVAPQREHADMVVPFPEEIIQLEIDAFIAQCRSIPKEVVGSLPEQTPLEQYTYQGIILELFPDCFTVRQAENLLYRAHLDVNDVATIRSNWRSLSSKY